MYFYFLFGWDLMLAVSCFYEFLDVFVCSVNYHYIVFGEGCIGVWNTLHISNKAFAPNDTAYFAVFDDGEYEQVVVLAKADFFDGFSDKLGWYKNFDNAVFFV